MNKTNQKEPGKGSFWFKNEIKLIFSSYVCFFAISFFFYELPSYGVFFFFRWAYFYCFMGLKNWFILRFLSRLK